MVPAARVAPVLLGFLLVGSSAIAQVSQSGSPISTLSAAVTGRVLGADGRPASGIHIELDDARTAVPVTSTYTQSDGTFELYNIPQGNYEVIAESSSSQVSNPLSFETGQSHLQLQFPSSTTAANQLDATTSVARMMVPPRAERLYQRALTDFNRGKYDEAEKQLDEALQIDQGFADALTLRGLIEIHEGNFAQGQEYLEQATRLDSSQSAAYVTLAAIYNRAGRFEDAMYASEKTLSLSPRAWQPYLEMAKVSIARSMYQSGLKFLRQAERLGGGTYAEVHLLKAYALVPLKLYKDAKYELQASMARDHHGSVSSKAQEMLARLDTLESAGVANQP
jgi:tetratricopeptide (TPR) repeat protein